MQYTVPNTEGYVLFAPILSKQTYLIDKCGREIHQWQSNYRAGLSATLQPNGNLLRAGNTNNLYFSGGGAGGVVEKYNWSGTRLWHYLISDSTQCQHHEAKVMPNGNILVSVWDRRTSTDAIANGKKPSATSTELWSEKILELQPVGTDSAIIVWEWHAWDHLVQEYDSTKLNFDSVAFHPELLDINFFNGPPTSFDWIHINNLDYNPALDEILVSAHNFSEIWILDHSTTTTQASGHTGGNSGMGGDLIYRWGNPQAYNRGTSLNQQLFTQHDAEWIQQGTPNEGKVIVFNNGNARTPTPYSSVDIIDVPAPSNYQYPINPGSPYGPISHYWTYTASNPTSFYANNISGAQPLANGSFMITNGPAGTFFEIDSNSNQVWEYINPVNNSGAITQGIPPMNNSVFRCALYDSSYSAFAGQTLTPGTEIELNPTSPSLCSQVVTPVSSVYINIAEVYPNPVNNVLHIKSVQPEANAIQLFTMDGKLLSENRLIGEGDIDLSLVPSGVYLAKVSNGNKNQLFRVAILH